MQPIDNTQRRKARRVMASDAEWNEISIEAQKLGISKSKLLIERFMTPLKTDQNGKALMLPETAQWALLRELLVLATIAKDNLQQRGEAERLAQICAAIDTRIESYEIGF